MKKKTYQERNVNKSDKDCIKVNYCICHNLANDKNKSTQSTTHLNFKH